MRIALLEDDQDQSRMMRLWLQDSDIEVTVYTTGAALVRALKGEIFDMVLLDWGVPDMDGMEVLNWIRRQLGWTLPVIFTTSRDEEEAIVQALNNGADDYLVKPLSRVVLMARIQAMARRTGLKERPADTLTVGEYSFDRKRRVCEREGEEVSLTAREFDLALYFFENLGRILSRETLLHQVWGATGQLQTRTVDTHVSRVRQKLSLRPENGWNLQAVYHYGYRLERLSEES
ncbi:MAG: response regulator transcription factor [Wenzhouxiangellaceae bacterium]